MLKRAIVTNVDLKRWGLSDCDDCFFCEKAKETIDHLFCECSVVTEFRNQVIICVTFRVLYCTCASYFGVRNELGQTQSWATSRNFYCRSNVPDKSIESQIKIIACITKDNKSIETIYNIRTLLINQNK